MSVDTEWPTLVEELERKAIDTLHTLVHRNVEGDLGKAELIAAVGAVYDVISGLVGWEIADMVNKVLMEARK